MLLMHLLGITVAAMFRPGFKTASLSPDIKVIESTDNRKPLNPGWNIAVVMPCVFLFYQSLNIMSNLMSGQSIV